MLNPVTAKKATPTNKEMAKFLIFSFCSCSFFIVVFCNGIEQEEKNTNMMIILFIFQQVFPYFSCLQVNPAINFFFKLPFLSSIFHKTAQATFGIDHCSPEKISQYSISTSVSKYNRPVPLNLATVNIQIKSTINP